MKKKFLLLFIFFNVILIQAQNQPSKLDLKKNAPLDHATGGPIATIAAALTVPSDGAVGVTVTPNFEFTSTTGNGAAVLDIATDAGFGGGTIVYSQTIGDVDHVNWDNIVGDLEGSLLNQIQLSNSTTYYWRVSPGIFGPYSFTTISAAMPYLSYPTNGMELIGTSTTFQWYTVPFTTGIQYDLQIAKDVSFTTKVVSQAAVTITTTTNTYFTISNTAFENGTTYYWRVISKTIAGTPVIIDYSNYRQFTMPGLPTPITSYPTGNVTIYNNPPTLYWYTNTYNSNVTQYVVRYRRSDKAYQSNPTASDENYGTFTTLSTSTFVTIPAALSAGYQYYWEVASSSDGTTLSAWSDEASFTVYGNATFIASYPSYPIGGVTIYSNPPTLYWYTNAFAPGITYTLQVKSGSTGGADITGSPFSPITTNSYTLGTALTAGVHYYWRVKATLGAITGSYSDWGDFIVASTSAAAPPVPTPASPTGGSVVYVTNPTLSWYAYASEPIQFQVKYDTDPTLTSGVLANSTTTTTGWLSTNSYVLSGLTPGATYYWQVKSRLVSDLSESSMSTLAWFTVSAGAASVVPIAGSPINGTPIDNTTAVLSWILPVQSTSPLTYDVQYSKQANFSDAVTISNLNSTNVTIDNLDKGSTYYWRALSKTNSGSVSNYSATTSFNTGKVTDVPTEEKIPTEYSLSQNYPNPFNPTTRITYGLPENTFVTLKIYDILGREVNTLVNQEMIRGVHNVDWDGKDKFGNPAASGAYIYRLTAGKYVSIKKMLLLK